MPRSKKDTAKGKMIHIRLSGESHTKLCILVAEPKSTSQDWVSTLIDQRLKRKASTSKK